MTDWSLNPRIRIAARIMKKGGVIAYPTEAVWGLGCNPFDYPAVDRLLALKDRSVDKGLILIATDMTQIEPFIDHLDDLQRQRLKNSWPGPVTWLVPDNGVAPEWIIGKFTSLALRVTDHPIAAALCKSFGGPIVSTSANPQGCSPARDQLTLRRYFGQQLDGITCGGIGKRSKPSEIRDLTSGDVLRPG